MGVECYLVLINTNGELHITERVCLHSKPWHTYLPQVSIQANVLRVLSQALLPALRRGTPAHPAAVERST